MPALAGYCCSLWSTSEDGRGMNDPVCFPVLPGEAPAQSRRRLHASLMLLSNSSQFRHTHGNAIIKQILFFIHTSGSRFSVLHQAIWEPFKPFWAVSTYSVAPVGLPVFLWSSSLPGWGREIKYKGRTYLPAKPGERSIQKRRSKL